MNRIFRNARLICPEGGACSGDLFVADERIVDIATRVARPAPLLESVENGKIAS